MKLVLVAAAVAVVAVPGSGAQARSETGLRLRGLSSQVISPNGNGINDVLRVHVAAPSGSVLGLRAYVWGGRLVGWKRIRTGVTVSGGSTLTWNGTTSTGHPLEDGTYVVTVCSARAGRLLPAEGVPRPGLAEASVRRPPWRRSGCLAEPRVIRIERLAAFVDSTGSFRPDGPTAPLVVSADRGQATEDLRLDCRTGPSGSTSAFRGAATPGGLRGGLYHYVVRDAAGDEFQAPVVMRTGARSTRRPRTPRSSSGRT